MRGRIFCSDASIYEELLGLRFQISPFSFFPDELIGRGGAVRKRVSMWVRRREKSYLTFTAAPARSAQILAPVAEKVVGVEIVGEAVEAARENAARNGRQLRISGGDVLKVVDELEEKPDLIVLDPPRDGIHPKAIGKILNFGVSHMVYVSCKPTSLARIWNRSRRQDIRWIRCAAWICSRILPL